MKYRAAWGGPFCQGDYADALRMFQDEWRGAIKNTQSRWIDSICYHAMMGECYYQMGDLPQALENYSAALRLYVAFPDWMVRVQFPAAIRQSGANPQIPWGPSTRRALRGDFSSTMLISQGQIDNNAPFRQGGIVQQMVLMPIDVPEIVRCTALAIRRRTELLGPLCQHDPLTGAVIAALSARPAPPNHWCQAWVDVPLGLALIGGNKPKEAMLFLSRSTVAAGQYDHPLTAVALLELGRLAMQRGDYPTAAQFFREASISAVYYPDISLVEEALRLGAQVHLLANNRGVYPPLEPAAQWAKIKDLRQLRASLLLSMAENVGVMGQTAQMQAFLDEAVTTIGRRQMGAGFVGARLNYLRAMALFQLRKTAPGDAALAAAMGYMRHGSNWLFQIAQVDQAFTSGQINTRGPITPRGAMDIYAELLRDPDGADWAMRPMDSLATLVTPHPASYEHWFLTALERKDHEVALEISDRARRHRFFSSLGFGGRLLALRWILEAPEAELDAKALLERQTLLAEFPAYANLAKQARKIQADLEKLPLVTADATVGQQQSQGCSQLVAISADQEAALREMALRRVNATLVFPPLRRTRDLQAALAPGHVLLTFFNAGGDLYGFLINRERYTYWRVKAPASIMRKAALMLRDLGLHEANRVLNTKDLADTAWKQPAADVLREVLDGSQADFAARFDELAIVPDGFLWYLPFEALQVKVQEQFQPLVARFRIRYAPTVALALPGPVGVARDVPTAVLPGRLLPQDDDSVAQAAFAELSRAVPNCVALSNKPPLPAPSAVYSTLMKRLIVLDDLAMAEGNPYAWSPIQTDRTKPGNTLNDWFFLPWGGPEVVILPGFHMATESALKQANSTAPGMEVFLTACGLMANGAKTAVLSRWRTGGQSAMTMVREFAQELPHSPPSEAWQRAVLVLADTRLDLNGEPRVKASAGEENVRGNHPFFWAGYMLIDRGEPGNQAAPPTGEGPLKSGLNLKEAEAPAPGEKPELPKAETPDAGNDVIPLGGGADLEKGKKERKASKSTHRPAPTKAESHRTTSPRQRVAP